MSESKWIVVCANMKINKYWLVLLFASLNFSYESVNYKYMYMSALLPVPSS